MPVLIITATGLWQSQQERAVRIWLVALTLAVLTTMVTKILFFGWGIGIAVLDFTGISGHTVLATSVLPVFFRWLPASDQERINFASTALGLVLSLGVGASRVVLGAHSYSEVVTAWIIGLAVSGLALNTINGKIQRRWFARLAPLVLLLALGTTTANFLPTHDWEVEFSLALSGRAQPYTRHYLATHLSKH